MAARDECYSPLSYSPLSSPVSRHYYNEDGNEATAGGHYRKDSGQLLDEAWETLADETPLSVPPQHDIVPRSRSSTSPLHSRPGGAASKISESDLRNFANFVKTKTVTESAGGGSGRSSSGGASGGAGKDGGGKFQRLWSFRNGAKGGEEGGDGGGGGAGGTAGTGTGGSGTAGSAEGRSGGSGKKERFLEQVIKTGGQAARVWSNPRRRSFAEDDAPSPMRSATFTRATIRTSIGGGSSTGGSSGGGSNSGSIPASASVDDGDESPPDFFRRSATVCSSDAASLELTQQAKQYPQQQQQQQHQKLQLSQQQWAASGLASGSACGGRSESPPQDPRSGSAGKSRNNIRGSVSGEASSDAAGSGSEHRSISGVARSGSVGSGSGGNGDGGGGFVANNSPFNARPRSPAFPRPRSPICAPSRAAAAAAPPPKVAYFSFDRHREAVAEAEQLDAEEEAASRQGRRRDAFKSASVGSSSSASAGGGAGDGGNANGAGGGVGWPAESGGNAEGSAQVLRRGAKGGSFESMAQAGPIGGVGEFGSGRRSGVARGAKGEGTARAWELTITQDGDYGEGKDDERELTPTKDASSKHRRGFRSRSFSGIGTLNGTNSPEAPTLPTFPSSSSPNPGSPLSSERRTYSPHASLPTSTSSSSRVRPPRSSTGVILPPLGASSHGHHPHHRPTIPHRRTVGDYEVDADDESPGRSPYNRQPQARRNRTEVTRRRPSTAMPDVGGGGSEDGSYRRSRSVGHGYELYLPPVSGGIGAGEGCYEGRGEREAGEQYADGRSDGRLQQKQGMGSGGGGRGRAGGEGEEEGRLEEGERRRADYVRQRESSQQHKQQQQYAEGSLTQSASPLRHFNRCFNRRAAATAGVLAPSADAAAVTRLITVVNGGAAGTNALTAAVENIAARSLSVATQASLFTAVALFVSNSPAVAADDVVAADVASSPFPQEIRRGAPRHQIGTQSLAQIAASQLRTAPPLTVTSTDVVETAEVAAADTADMAEQADTAAAEAAEAAEAPKVLDGARLLTESQRGAMLRQLSDLESRDGWRIRVATRYGMENGLDGKQIRDLWQPSDRTVIVVADVASPNILSFSIGEAVRSKLPYQFFTELQSRYGNQFFVRQEGESEALTRSVDAIRTCLTEPNGCLKVPGLVDDLYFLTLGVSVAAGAVFGFSARLPPHGQVEASWQWVAIFSPLWLFLLLAFGVFPVVDRTADLEPLIKNLLGFAGSAGAVYMTPILGESPVARLGKTQKEDGDV
ncbi:unnamed protein product [Closterium sp. Yama58-4]|nr:unnamed protein product [Closterium sp. Yama58-4]